MLAILRDNIQFTLILMVWLIAGAISAPLSFAVIGLSIFLLARREYFIEVYTGFWIILILSDSQLVPLEFAGNMKVLYILLLAVVLFINRSELLQYPTRILRLFVPFFIYALVLVFLAPDPVKSLQKTVSYILLFSVIPVFVNYFVQTDRRAFFRTVVFFLCLYLALGLVAKYTITDQMILAGRYRAFMGNPNGLGVLLAMSFILFDVFRRTDRGAFDRREVIIVLGLILVSLLFSGSRSAMVTVGIYTAFSFWRFLHGFVGFAVFVLILMLYPSFLEALPGIITSLGLEDYLRLDTLEEASGRFIAWNFAWESIQDNYLVGRGFNYSEYLFGENFHRLSRMGHVGNAHNSYLTFWLDTGLIGLMLFIIPLILTFLRVFRTNTVALPFMYAILFSTMFESWLIGSLNPFTIILLTILTVLESGVQIEAGEEEEIAELSSAVEASLLNAESR